MGEEIRIKLVVFDLDSTLTDSLATLVVSRLFLIEEIVDAGWAERDTVRAEFRKLLVEDIHDPLILPKLNCLGHEKDETGRSDQALEDLNRRYFDEIRRNSTLLPSTEDVLISLRDLGVQIVVWTNKAAPFVKLHLVDLGLDGLIDRVYCVRRPGQPLFESISLGRTIVVEVPKEKRKPSTVDSHAYCERSTRRSKRSPLCRKQPQE